MPLLVKISANKVDASYLCLFENQGFAENT
jgi:hypothetical protein